jgi:flagellar basal-body rod protein FlgB
MVARLFSGQLESLLHKGLDASALQHKVISNNIANVDTPGFKRSQVIFKDRLKSALEARQRASENLQATLTNSAHFQFNHVPDIGGLKPLVTQDKSASLRNDGNNVDIDREMAYMTENTLLYNTLAQLVNSRFDGIRSAISEGRR